MRGAMYVHDSEAETEDIAVVSWKVVEEESALDFHGGRHVCKL